jgi:hypothetical protein
LLFCFSSHKISKAQKVFILSAFEVLMEVFALANKPSVTGPKVRKLVLNKDLASKILRSVPEQEGFRFYLAIGEPTGEIAVSLADFVKKLETIDVRSVNFHFPRKDFEKWIRGVIGDAELALRIGRIRLGIQGEALRNEIIRAVKVRLNELKPPLPATSKPPSYGGA